MNVEYHCKYDKLVNPDDLKPHPKNANMHPEKQIDALCKFIRVSGFRQPVTVSNLSGFIVAGHARRVASKRVGCKAPVVYQNFESESDELAYLLAITDDSILQSNLDFLEENGFALEDIGFDLDIDLNTCSTDCEVDTSKGGGTESERASLDEVRVFVLPEKRLELFDTLKSFASDHGESSIRWQRA